METYMADHGLTRAMTHFGYTPPREDKEASLTEDGYTALVHELAFLLTVQDSKWDYLVDYVGVQRDWIGNGETAVAFASRIVEKAMQEVNSTMMDKLTQDAYSHQRIREGLTPQIASDTVALLWTLANRDIEDPDGIGLYKFAVTRGWTEIALQVHDLVDSVSAAAILIQEAAKIPGGFDAVKQFAQQPQTGVFIEPR